MGGAESQCMCSCGRSYGHGHSIFGVHSDVEHESHQCDAQYCPIPCQLCKRLCSSPDHLHALEVGAIHLCGYVIRWCASRLRNETPSVGNHILAPSGVPLPVYAKSTQPLNRLKKRSKGCMNASSTQRYVFTSLYVGSNTKRIRCMGIVFPR